MFVVEKKKFIRASVQELNRPASVMSAHEAMKTLCWAVCLDFDVHGGSIGVFVGDDDFKEEIFSARVIQVIIIYTVSQDKDEYPSNFYHCGCCILYLLCSDNTELADVFVAHDGVEFLLESLEAFSSDQFLLTRCFTIHVSVMGSLSENRSAAFAGMMILGKLVDVFELNYETANEMLYYQYCVDVGNSLFLPGVCLDVVNKKVFQRIVSHVWHGVIKHKYYEKAQSVGRRLLCYLVGKEAAKEMIEHRAEMHHCEGE
jgi:hypothetical protein